MRRHLRRWAAILGIGCIVTVPRTGLGQDLDRQPPADLTNLSHRMADQVRRLGEDIESDLGRTPAGRELLQDTRQLADSVDAFHESLHDRPDLPTLQRSYRPIVRDWRHLRARLTLPGVSTRAVDEAAGGVDELEIQMSRALRLGVAADLSPLAQELAVRVRRLCEDIDAEMGGTRAGQELLPPAWELAEAVVEFRESTERERGAFRLRQDYSRIEVSWNHLQSEFARHRVPRVVERAARDVGEIDLQIHDALGMRPYPTDDRIEVVRDDDRGRDDRDRDDRDRDRGDRDRNDQFAETRRVALALQDRADALVEFARAELADVPNGPHMIQDAVILSRQTDVFYRSLRREQSLEVIQTAFQPIATVSDCLENDLSNLPSRPPQFQQSWDSFASSEVLIRQNLGLPTPPPQVHVVLRPPNNEPSPLIGMADTLVTETETFLQVFGPTAGAVPEGGRILADAQQLHAAATAFRDGVSQGIDPGRLAADFSAVDTHWGRLARRVNRIARGRTGPNIQQVQKLGGIVQQIHQLLALPGYPPVLGPFED